MALVGTLLACGGGDDDDAGSANRDPVREDPVDGDPSDGRADGAEPAFRVSRVPVLELVSGDR